MSQTIIDSDLSQEQAIGSKGPRSIRSRQALLKVCYVGFDGKKHSGQIVIHEQLASEVREWFALAEKIEFPIQRVEPAVVYGHDDNILMAKNISSGFNYRKISGTNRASLHGRGLAFDINPHQNPYIRKEKSVIIAPPNAHWQPKIPGTLNHDHELVRFMLKRGWEWGGDWSLEQSGRVDYQHFQKAID